MCENTRFELYADGNFRTTRLMMSINCNNIFWAVTDMES